MIFKKYDCFDKKCACDSKNETMLKHKHYNINGMRYTH